jgi:hypothetical protein
MLICRTFTGATGLEPATSGVTGPFEDPEVNDEGHGIPLFMRPFGSRLSDSACSSGIVSDVCCPFAAREGPLGIPVDALPWFEISPVWNYAHARVKEATRLPASRSRSSGSFVKMNRTS